MRALLALAALAVGAVTSAPSAATPAPAPLAPLLEPIRARTGVPALGAALLRGRNLVGIGVVGVRRIGHPEPVTMDDAWVLASCTKAMTATLAARLVEAGKIRWDTRVADALPGLEMQDGYRGATLAQLLAHRAGLPRDVSQRVALTGVAWWWSLLSPLGPFVPPSSVADRRASLVAGALGLAPASALGAYQYSNIGYVVAGAMLEAAGGASWETLMERELFAPLGMSAGFGVPGSPGEAPGPWGHVVEDGVVRAIEPGPYAGSPLETGPAGAVHANLADWARFVASHLASARGEPAADPPFLTADSLRRLHAPVDGGEYALGWSVTRRDWTSGPVLTHHGTNLRSMAQAWIFPAENTALLVVVNQADAQAGAALAATGNAVVRYAFPARFR